MTDRRLTGAMSWPGGHRFAFTIFDDTDHSTVTNGRPMYRLLTSRGLRITKSVWPGPNRRPGTVGGSTCADPDYLDWVLSLQAAGHEIGFHNTSDHSSTRDETIEGLERFRGLFGHDPFTGADHAGNAEALYAGANRLSGHRAAAYRTTVRLRQPGRPDFSGEDPDSPYFWGDLCRERIRYWRGLTFADTNLSRVSPSVAYHDDLRPYVRAWFLATHAPDRGSFLRRLAPDALDRLEAEGGVCVLFAHLGHQLVDDGVVDPQIVRVIDDVARRDAWFAPVHDVLAHLERTNGLPTLGARERRRLEHRWVANRLRYRTPVGPASKVQTMSDAR